DLRAIHLEGRKRRLAHLLDRARIAQLLHSETFEDGSKLLDECGARKLEGVVAKHRASMYRSGRSTSWVKVKCPAWREANRNRGELFGESDRNKDRPIKNAAVSRDSPAHRPTTRPCARWRDALRASASSSSRDPAHRDRSDRRPYPAP